MFHPFKSEWKNIVHEYRYKNNGIKVTREEFPLLLESSTIISGFRTCGLFPFTDDAIDNDKLINPIEEPLLNNKTTSTPNTINNIKNKSIGSSTKFGLY